MKTRGILAVLMFLAIAAGPASEPTTAPSYPALQRKLAELSALVEQLNAKIKQLESENAGLHEKLAALAATASQPEAAQSRAKRLHQIAPSGRSLYPGRDQDALKKEIGEPDEIRVQDGGRLWRYVAGDYELDVVVSSGVIDRFVERGTMPK